MCMCFFIRVNISFECFYIVSVCDVDLESSELNGYGGIGMLGSSRFNPLLVVSVCIVCVCMCFFF